MNLVQSLLPQRPQIIRPLICYISASRSRFILNEAEVLRFERARIVEALAKVKGKVTHAAELLGMNYQKLAYIIETSHPDLLKKRTPVRRRPRKGTRKKHR